MKAASKGFVAIAIAVVIVLLLAVLFINSLIRTGIEVVGSRSLGTEVELSRAHLSYLRGRLALSGLKISNPKGFKTERLFQLARASAAVQPATLFQDEITIETVVLNSPSLTVEQSIHGTNLAAVMENIQSEKTKDGAKTKEKSYRIKMLKITGARVTFSSLVAMKSPVTIPLPDIQIQNLTNEDGTGLILAQVVQRVLVKMLQAALTEGKGLMPTEALSDLRRDLGNVVPDLAGSTLGTAKGTLAETAERMKGLFKR